MSLETTREQSAREFGGIQERLKSLEAGQTSMQRDLREIRDVVVSVKGGWKTIAAIAAISAAVGGLIGKLIPWFMSLPR